MATPRPVSYRVASGGIIYGGRFAPAPEIPTVNLAGSGSTQSAQSGAGAISFPVEGAPLWLQGLAVNTWTEIPGSAMANSPPSIDPGRASGGITAIVDAWCGFSLDTRDSTVWGPGNGGHDDSHYNGVPKLVLSTDAPVWIEVLPSNSASEFTLVDPVDGLSWNQPRYSNGAPVSVHSYYCQQFIEARNKAVRFGTPAAAQRGNSFKNCDSFNVSTGVWDAESTIADLPVNNGPARAVCKNPITEDVFFFDENTSVLKWTQSTNTWSQINVGYPPIDPGESASRYDTVRNRIFLLRGTGSGSSISHTFDPATGTFTAQTLSGAAASTVMAATKGYGMVYVPELDAYLVRLRAAGSAVYKIDASTFTTTTLSTTGGDSIPTTFNVSGTPENVYGKFLYVPQYSGVLYIPSYSANAWFLRTHA
jgi:hypothetical protein